METTVVADLDVETTVVVDLATKQRRLMWKPLW